MSNQLLITIPAGTTLQDGDMWRDSASDTDGYNRPMAHYTTGDGCATNCGDVRPVPCPSREAMEAVAKWMVDECATMPYAVKHGHKGSFVGPGVPREPSLLAMRIAGVVQTLRDLADLAQEVAP